MFAVCSSWFEIDERKWTYYHHGSHNDWELGAKTPTVPASKVLDSEWYCFIICKIPQWQFWFILRVTHNISLFLIPFFVSVFLEKTQFIRAFQDAAVLSMALLNISLLDIKCAIFLKFLCRVFDWYVLGGLQYTCKIFTNLPLILINSKSLTDF